MKRLSGITLFVASTICVNRLNSGQRSLETACDEDADYDARDEAAYNS